MKIIKKIINKIKSFFVKKEQAPTPPDLGIHVEESIKSTEVFGRP